MQQENKETPWQYVWIGNDQRGNQYLLTQDEHGGLKVYKKITQLIDLTPEPETIVS